MVLSGAFQELQEDAAVEQVLPFKSIRVYYTMLLQLLDFVSTLLVVSHTKMGFEANPIVAYALGLPYGVMWFLLLKCLATVLAVIVCRRSLVGTYFINVPYTLVVLWNFMLYILILLHS